MSPKKCEISHYGHYLDLLIISQYLHVSISYEKSVHRRRKSVRLTRAYFTFLNRHKEVVHCKTRKG
jgi:hypothetical protein